MEEIGSRATIFELEGLGSEKRKYLKWLLVQSVAPKTKIESVVTELETFGFCKFWLVPLPIVLLFPAETEAA
jgi:hypothetical protein